MTIRRIHSIVLAVVLLVTAPSLGAQTTTAQTPTQILDQISALLDQLRGMVGATQPPPVIEPPPPPPATTTVVTSASTLNTALASRVQDITLTGGTIYTGNWNLTAPVTIHGPADAVLMPADPLLQVVQVSASNVTLSLFGVRCGAPDRECMAVGSLTATSASQQPDNVTIDGLDVRAGASGGHRGIALHGSHLTVRNSRVTGFYEKNRDSQAIWIHNGPGPYTIENNYLEASGETVLTGGDTLHIQGVIPSDIIIRSNTLVKNAAWNTADKTSPFYGVVVKNVIELKEAKRALVENNTIDGNWRPLLNNGQDGTPIVLTVRDQYNDSPWVTLQDITVRNNLTKNCPDGFAVSILGLDDDGASVQAARIDISHNLFRDSPGGFKIGNGVADSLVISHNTLPAIRSSFLSFWQDMPNVALTPLVFEANVTKSGDYGIVSDRNTTVGSPSLILTKVVSFAGNVIELTAARTIAYPAGNTLIKPSGLLALLDPVTFKLLSGTAGY